MPQSLIQLDALVHSNPCTEAWHAMPGDEWKRHCDKCGQNVYNISAMTRGEAQRLLADHAGKVCTTFYRRTDGTILTQRCPSSIRKGLKRIGRWGLAAGLAMPAFAHDGGPCPRGEVKIERRPAGADSPVIEVVVMDASGAVIPGARVEIGYLDRAPLLGTTDAAGRFRAQGAAPGLLSVRAETEGFKTTVREGVELAASESLSLAVTMEIGSVGGPSYYRSGLPANPVRWPNSLMRWFRRKLT